MPRHFTCTLSYQILSMLAHCEWLSGRGLKLLPYTEDRIMRNLKQLQEADLLSCKKTGAGKCYTLRTKGKMLLQSFEPSKYGVLTDSYLKHNLRQVERGSLVGESVAAFHAAGYAALEKPTLERCIENGIEGVYFTAKELKRYISSLHDDGADRKAVNYSRISGVLLTGSGLVQVYSTSNTAQRLRKTGEEAVHTRLQIMTKRLYGDSEAVMTVVLGDKEFRAAGNILQNSLREAIPHKKRGQAEDAGNMTLEALGSKALYMPATKQALPLLSLLGYPDWEQELARTCVKAVGGTPTPGTRYANGYGDDGDIFVFIGLDLARLYNVLRICAAERPKQGIEIICLDWQSNFLTSLIRRELPSLKFAVSVLPDTVLIDLARYLNSG